MRHRLIVSTAKLGQRVCQARGERGWDNRARLVGVGPEPGRRGWGNIAVFDRQKHCTPRGGLRWTDISAEADGLRYSRDIAGDISARSQDEIRRNGVLLDVI